MTPPPGGKDFWDDKETTPADIARGQANRQKVLADLIRHALSGRELSASMVAEWHRDLLLGLSYVTNASLLGGYRGSKHPLLEDLGVAIGGVRAVSPYQIESALTVFFRELKRRLVRLAAAAPIGRDKTKRQLRMVANLAGWAHGEWVRIHPFANGNGRTARLIANWILARFRILPVLRVRPRPGHPYDNAGSSSMHGDHRPIASLIFDLSEATRGK